MQNKENFFHYMKHIFSDQIINEQKQKVFQENPAEELVAPCKIGEGVLRLTEEEKRYFEQIFTDQNASIGFFIPASGSGSRMFQFLYEFLEDPNDENRSQVERFLNSITDFAFYKLIPKSIRKSIQQQTISLEGIVTYLLQQEGLGFGIKPKGLIPFHLNDPFILNPFQEHVLQGAQLENEDFSFHFTVQAIFEKEIQNSISQAEGLIGEKYAISFSEQAIESNSIAFTEEKIPFLDSQQEIVSRPAGHGALLSHLNKLKEELIFIKNIDNIQHLKNASETLQTWKLIGGLLLDFKTEIKRIYTNPSMEALHELNSKFQVFSDQQINSCNSDTAIRKLLDRPTRVCGMVKNVGQPGGGPFWVNTNGVISKQIVEKAQISMRADQYRLMVQSTHFNPVMVATSAYSVSGEKFDFEEYKDPSKYFVVRKKHQGKPIRFMELPGLWNGGMYNWNTLFVEIPTAAFTPVKNILDLLGEAHKE